MKKLILSALLCLAMSLCNLQAQVSYKSSPVSLQPLWGPTGFNMANYYYIPDIEAYYDVMAKQFIYLEDGEWAFSKTLPALYKDYDLYSGYKVVINLPQPYLNFNAHLVRYARFKGQLNKQVSIKDSTKPKYSYIAGHDYTLNSVLKNSRSKVPQ